MTVGQAKQIIGQAKFDKETQETFARLLSGDDDRKLLGGEIKGIVEAIENEIESDRKLIEVLDDTRMAMNSFVNQADEASEILDNDLKSLQ